MTTTDTPSEAVSHSSAATSLVTEATPHTWQTWLTNRLCNGRAQSKSVPDDETLQIFGMIAGVIVLGVLANMFIGEKTTFLLKEQLGLSAGDVTSLNLLIHAPLYLQPLIAAGTEIYPLFGRHRRSYFALGAVVSALALLLLAFQAHYSLMPVIAAASLYVFGLTLRLVVFNGVTVALGNRIQNYKAIQTLQTLLPLILSASFTGHFGGIVTQYWSYRAAYGAGTLMTLLTLLLLPLLPESRDSEDNSSPAGQATVAVGGVSEADHDRKGAASSHCPNQLRRLRRVFADRRLWIVTGFIAYFGLAPSPDTARPYFYADALHLSKEFIGTLSGWRSAGAIVGILLSQIAPRMLRLRPLATIATVMWMLYFLPLLAIHDARSAIWGVTASAMIGTISAFTYSWMFSRACPKGVEATIYGMLGAVQAFCYLLCDWLGTHLYEWFGPVSHHTARYGWYASVLVCLAIGLPLLAVLPFLPKHDLASDSPKDLDNLDDSEIKRNTPSAAS